jgi:hypothetical protein
MTRCFTKKLKQIKPSEANYSTNMAVLGMKALEVNKFRGMARLKSHSKSNKTQSGILMLGGL